MADPEPDKPSGEDVLKILQDLNRDLEQLLEKMEKVSGNIYKPSRSMLEK